jgi:hypothetical protein
MTQEQLDRANSIKHRMHQCERNLGKIQFNRRNHFKDLDIVPNQAKSDYVSVPKRMIDKIWDILEEDYKKEIEELNKEFIEL